MMRAFYLFPCSHRFHADCLVAEVLPHLPASVSARASDLQRRIAAAAAAASVHGDPSPAGTTHNAAAAAATSSPAAGSQQQEQSLKDELDKLVASECVYCGDVMIRMVDKPFVSDEDYESVVHSWL